MAQGDYAVQISSQLTTLAEDLTQTLAVPAPETEIYPTQGLPRTFLWLLQSSPGPSALVVTIEWAIRMNAANTPDFLLLQQVVLVPGTVSTVLLTTGALFYRFRATVPGGLETVQIRAASFV